jgi:hypothetical protein
VEQRFDDCQRHLLFLCAKDHVRAFLEANLFLVDEVTSYNEQWAHVEIGQIPLVRWQRTVAEGRGRLHAPLAHLDPALVFSLHYKRTIRKDGTWGFLGQTWHVGQHPNQRVTVCWILDDRLWVVNESQRAETPAMSHLECSITAARMSVDKLS